jgi:hypothetical protein
MYREKRDLSEKKVGKVLSIYSVYRAFPKRSQRKNIWNVLCWKEPRYIHVELTGYFIGRKLDIIGKRDYRIFRHQVRALRKKLGNNELKIFDRFYYERS